MIEPPSIRLEAFAEREVLLGTVTAAPVSIGPAGPALLQEIEECAADLRRTGSGRSPAEISALAPARQLYRSFGIDPTKLRPSSEALLRRVLHDQPLPRICNAVDLANLLALRFLLPIGLYDAAKIEGAVSLRRGLPDEVFTGIRKERVHLTDRPVLADRHGPFGNPTSDSLRTAVEPRTRALWLVIFAPASFPPARLEAHVHTAQRAIERHLAPGGAAVSTRGAVLPDARSA